MSKENKNEEETKNVTENIEIPEVIKVESKESGDSSKVLLERREHKKIISLIVVIAIVLIFFGVLFFIVYGVIPKLNSYVEENNNEKIELKYTDTSDSAIEGVYVTDVSNVVQNVMPSIVAITSKTLISSGFFGPSFFGKDQYSEGAGSGIIISKSSNDLMILTNNHVVDGASELSVQFINEKSYDAKIVGTSERKDIAIISIPLSKIDAETLATIKIATIGNSDELKVGNGIIAIGNALGYGQSVTTGVVSALNREVSIDNYTNKMIQIDAAINGGNSGGALLNSRGEVIGINSAKYSSSATSTSASIEGMGFAIPISDISDLITSLMNGEEDTSVTLGIEGYIVTEDYSEAYNMPRGFYISKIVSGSSADKSDLEIGNIITKINGNDVKSLSDIQNVLYELKKGDKVKLTVSYIKGRSYTEKEITVTLS